MPLSVPTPQIPLTVDQKADILSHFRDQKPTDADIAAYCTEKGYALMSLGAYQDEVAGYQTGLKTNELIPQVFALLAQMRAITTLDTEEAAQKLRDNNETVRAQLMQLIETSELELAFFDLVLEQISRVCSQTITGAVNAVRNTSATVMTILAKDKLGDPLTIKAIADQFREYGKDGRAVIE